MARRVTLCPLVSWRTPQGSPPSPYSELLRRQGLEVRVLPWTFARRYCEPVNQRVHGSPAPAGRAEIRLPSTAQGTPPLLRRPGFLCRVPYRPSRSNACHRWRMQAPEPSSPPWTSPELCPAPASRRKATACVLEHLDIPPCFAGTALGAAIKDAFILLDSDSHECFQSEDFFLRLHRRSSIVKS